MENKLMSLTHFLTRNELMDIMNISPSTLTRYMNDGLPYFKFKGRVLFNKDRIETFLTEHSVNHI